MGWGALVRELRGRPYQRHDHAWHEVTFADGLSASEFARVEAQFGWRFPDDLRELLRTALPVSSGFPDWRHGDATDLAERLAWPKHGLLFDVRHDALWLPEWGPRPAQLDEALAVAGAAIDAQTRLVPVFAHRMLPVEPRDAGNPVFSVWQSDVIYFGRDLEDYLRREFLDERRPVVGSLRHIPFWSDLEMRD